MSYEYLNNTAMFVCCRASPRLDVQEEAKLALSRGAGTVFAVAILLLRSEAFVFFWFLETFATEPLRAFRSLQCGMSDLNFRVGRVLVAAPHTVVCKKTSHGALPLWTFRPSGLRV